MPKGDGKKLVIATGTDSSQKIEHLQSLLKEMGIEGTIIPAKVPSGVSEQPQGEKEILRGSVNRSKEALRKNPKADIGLGIEVGYHENKRGDYEIVCCTTIVDSKDVVQSCFSGRLLLPKFHQRILKEGKYLGDHVREYRKGVDEPITNYIREVIISRKPLIVEATRNALITYLEKE
jgi:non-canonical (house-cleaning) NTP pyrophosphatase